MNSLSEGAEAKGRVSRTRAGSTRQRATRKRAVRKSADTAPEKVVREAASSPTARVSKERKAPTSIGARRATKKQKRNQIIVASVVILLGVGASAAVGFTDEGVIDVQKTIEARNERIRNNQASEQDTLGTSAEVPVQSEKAQKPDGGLRGLGTGGAKPKPPTPPASSTATSTATSTNQTASSTAEMVEDAATSTVETASSSEETTL